MNRVPRIAACATALILASSTAAARDVCPATDGPVSVFGLGGSTLASVLGPLLERRLARRGIVMHRAGWASSGIARPDFFDWFTLTPKLMDRFDPDIVVVALGGNDSQPLRHGKAWIRLRDPRWEEVYAERVDSLLKDAAGPDRERLVIWLAPHAFVDWRFEERGPIIARIMKERVEAFAKDRGRAVFIDVYGATLGPDGRPLKKARLAERRRPERIHSKDGIHLTARAVRYFMVKPILDAIGPCLDVDKEPSAVAAANRRAADVETSRPGSEELSPRELAAAPERRAADAETPRPGASEPSLGEPAAILERRAADSETSRPGGDEPGDVEAIVAEERDAESADRRERRE